MPKKVGGRNRVQSTNATEDSTLDSEADVVVDQFAREFATILQLTREKQSKTLTSESFGGSRDDVANSQQEVAFFGDIAQKLAPLVDRVMQATPDQIVTAKKKIELFLAFGDKFYHVREFRAASVFFYEKVLVLDEMMQESTAESSHRGVLERILASKSLTTPKRSRLEGQAYVRSLFGAAICCFHVQKRSDGFVKHPGRLEKMIGALTFVRLGMETAVAMEREDSGQFSWLSLNGSVLIYSIAKPLQTLGFSKEVVTYLKWSLLTMESTVALSTTKYIMWRLQLGSAICDCYQDLALKEVTKAEEHTKSALACASYLQQGVQRLRKEEELDMPLPSDVQSILVQAETASAMLMARTKAAVAHQPITRSAIETAFPAVIDQLRSAVGAMETLSREVKQKRGGGCNTILVSSASQQNEALSELFAFVMDIATPLLEQLVGAEESSAFKTEVAIFPLDFHLVVIRHSLELARPDQQMRLLIKSARTRLKFATDVVAIDEAMVTYLLDLYEVLHEVQRSWSSWEALSEDERLQSDIKPRLQLPATGASLPASQFLIRLSKAVQNCILHNDGAIPRTNHELMTSVALQMWREFMVPILKELDATEPSQFSKPLVRLACELLLTVHLAFTAVKFEDLLLHGQVCLRLATLFSIRSQTRTGSQIIRQCIERINTRRSELMNFDSHFHSVAGPNAGDESTASLSNASFTCKINDGSDASAQNNITMKNIRECDRAGVQGTGSQLGGLLQNLCCIQVDLLLLLYRLELQGATVVDTLPLSSTKALGGTSSVSSSSVLSAVETNLVEECHQNGYAHVLLNIQRLAHPLKSVKERIVLADESIQLLQQLDNEEEKLCLQLMGTPKQESVVPAPPIVISRSSSAITVKVVEYHPSQPQSRKKRVVYYMVFAKPAGPGTAVSTNNNLLIGTAAPIYPPYLHVTISGLLPNESYVFAVAAFDSKHELIHSIGETSEPVVSLNPLPLAMCYGYLAKVCYDVHLAGRANKAASYLYNAVVSNKCDGRPSWMANPFYRQALKRDAVAQFPVPILNLSIQALLILCHDEPGDLERNGKLVTSVDLDAHSLTTLQTKALEDSRNISMAVEIASATDNQEAIRVLCFKGYRLLLPLLHLNGSCDGKTFPALVTFYQALHVIPSEKWDIETRSICARVGYELFRIAQEANSDISRVTLPLLLSATLNHSATEQALSTSSGGNEEDDSLREVVALFKLASSSAPSSDTLTPSPPAAAITSPRGTGAKGAPAAVSKDKSQNNTPQATPRTAEGDADKGTKEGKLPCLDQLLQIAGNDLFVILEQHISSDRRAIEFASKICGAVLGAGSNEVAPFDKFVSSLKIAGTISHQFRATLSSLGGEAILPEPKEPVPTDDGAQPSKSSETRGIESTGVDAVFGPDDEYLYRWCGELFFLQSVLLFRKITKLCDTINAVDTARGPATEDCTYELLHGKHNDEDNVSHATQESDSKLAPSESSGEPHDREPTNSQELSSDPSNSSEIHTELQRESQLDQMFGELLEKSAACCKLFRLAKCWQGLQAVTQQLWNTVWLAWVAPSRISSSTRLGHLSISIDALLDMIDIAVNETGDHNAAVSASNAPPTSTEQSMILSTVVSAVSNAQNIDQNWLARLMAYSLKAFCAAEDWKSIVQKGSRYHFLCGSSSEGTRFSEQNFPLIIYAQQQIVNHQEALLKTAEQELSAFIKDFQEQESKKKKKKSRLVVEEVLSPGEIAFRANKQEMEQRIQELDTEHKIERKMLLDLTEIYDGLTKSINKSHQALNTCHDLVEKYRRLDQRSTNGVDGENMRQHQDELAPLRRQIISSYTRCVVVSRQKRQKRIVCQALQEAGDFHLACGDSKAATKSWLETLDNAFSMLHVGSSWREVLTPSADQFLEDTSGHSNHDKIAGDELWIDIQCCSALAKLMLHSSEVNLHKTVDFALMAATVFTRFYGCSVPHPTKCFLFGSYQMLGQLWPGRKLLGDPDRVFPFSFGVMLVMVPEVLLQYEHQYAVTAMPVITGYEFVAQFCLQDSNHVANAHRLRVEALVQCGRFHEAFQIILSLLRGGATPRSSSGVPEVETLVFHDGKSILDDSNHTILSWLIAFNAEQTQAELKKHYPDALVGNILMSILHVAVALASYENRYDRETAMVRPAAKKMAQTLLTLMITPTKTSETDVHGEAPSEHVLNSTSWEELQLHRLRADIHLQLSYIAFYEGEWSASIASSMAAISEYNAIPVGPDQTLHLDLDQQLKFSLVFSRGTFLAKCRLQIVACYLAQMQYRAAFEAAETAIKESKTTGEEHLRQHLELQRLQASVFLGEREYAEHELFVLGEDNIALHTSASLSYVRTLQVLSSLLRSKALLSSQPSTLIAVCERLSEAEQVLDKLLERDGWMGLDHHGQSSDHQDLAKRLNRYQPAIPDFVQVHADLAQVLLECPVNLDSDNVLSRQKRAQRSIESGLRALDHTTKRMSATRARLLLLKGVLLSKALYATTTPLGLNNEIEVDEQKLQQRFEECVESFVGCIKSSIEGGYDRQLVRLALIELVDLFGQKLIPGSEDAHVQAAFHYLNLAFDVQKHEFVLFDTLELQNGSVTSVEKLLTSICASINVLTDAQDDATSSSPTNSKPPDVVAILNFFVRLLRMQHILPVGTTAIQETCALLHSFLIQNHSTYSRMACLMELPSVPTTDPEIRAGMVCALWGQDLAPAITPVGEATHNGHITIFFTLGTTKVPIAEGSPAAYNAAAIARMETFASSPLLSKHSNLDRHSVQRLKMAFSKLRTQMEDEDSFLVNRGAFPKNLQSVLHDVQHLFRASNGDEHRPHLHGENIQDNQRDALKEIVSTDGLYDAFGNMISIQCTLDTVRRLEDLFSINKGANMNDTELCYFLRDLLD